MEGDPPLGKERGALGVGTGPTPLPKRSFPPQDVIKRPKIALEEQNISKIISKMPSEGKTITTTTSVKKITVTTVSSEGQMARVTKKKLRQVNKVTTDEKSCEVPSIEKKLTVTTVSSEDQMARVTTNKLRQVTKVSTYEKKLEVPSNENIITTINKLDTNSISTANTEGQMAKITGSIKPSNVIKASAGEKIKEVFITKQDAKPQIENDYVIPEQQHTKVKTSLRPPQKEENPKLKKKYNNRKKKNEDNSLTKITTISKPISTPTIYTNEDNPIRER